MKAETLIFLYKKTYVVSVIDLQLVQVSNSNPILVPATCKKEVSLSFKNIFKNLHPYFVHRCRNVNKIYF